MYKELRIEQAFEASNINNAFMSQSSILESGLVSDSTDLPINDHCGNSV